MLATLKASKKSVTAIAGGLITWGYLVIGSSSSPVTSEEWMALAVVVATGAGVYRVTNT